MSPIPVTKFIVYKHIFYQLDATTGEVIYKLHGHKVEVSISYINGVERNPKDKPIATEEDKQANANIEPFANCKRSSHQPTCVPILTKWEKTTEKDSINGMKKLTIESTCKCSQGGEISFIDTSENSFVDSE